MGPTFDRGRFIPFVVLHEFEGLLFSDCAAFSRGIERPDLEIQFANIRNQFPTPEDINDHRDTAPSKRLKALMSSYGKVESGVNAIKEIRLETIRKECPHFNSWIAKLETLPLL